MQETCDVRSCGAPLATDAMSCGLRLCGSCRNLLASRLISLPQIYRACEQALEVRHQHPVGIVRGRSVTGICLDDMAVAVRGDMIRVLSSWCQMIIDERRVTGPASLDVRMLTAFLRAHLPWIAAHAVAADFAAEIAALVAAGEQVLDPAHVRMIDLGRCARDGCGEMVRASLSSGSRPATPQVRCDAGHAWRPRQWLDLRHQPDPDREALA